MHLSSGCSPVALRVMYGSLLEQKGVLVFDHHHSCDLYMTCRYHGAWSWFYWRGISICIALEVSYIQGEIGMKLWPLESCCEMSLRKWIMCSMFARADYVGCVKWTCWNLCLELKLCPQDVWSEMPEGISDAECLQLVRDWRRASEQWLEPLNASLVTSVSCQVNMDGCSWVVWFQMFIDFTLSYIHTYLYSTL